MCFYFAFDRVAKFDRRERLRGAASLSEIFQNIDNFEQTSHQFFFFQNESIDALDNGKKMT